MRDGFAAHRLDLVDHLLRGGTVLTDAVRVAAEVVDDDLGAFGREQQRVLATEAAARTGDDGNPSVECAHDFSSRAVSGRGEFQIVARNTTYRGREG